MSLSRHCCSIWSKRGLSAKLAEKKEQKVDVKDIAPEVLSEMLSFIYFGKIRRLDKFATDLHAAADQYHLEQ